MPPDLLDLLSARKGHFHLESGHHGDLWLELEALLLHPDQLQPFILELVQKLSRHKIKAVCGPPVGGAFLAQALASWLSAEFYYTERFASSESGTLFAVEYRLPAGLGAKVQGKRVAIVDDVINAGSAVRGTLAELHVPVEAVAALPGNLWVPDECPLCAAGMPLEGLTTGCREGD